MLTLAAGLHMAGGKNAVTFSDVPAGLWGYPYIETAAAAGFLHGYGDGSFRPNQPLSRAEAAAVVFRLAPPPPAGYVGPTLPDVPAGSWAFADASAAVASGLLPLGSDGLFHPAAPVTREDFARAISFALTLDPSAQAPLTGVLHVVGGPVYLQTGGAAPQPVTGPAAVRAGDTISTGPGGSAQIDYGDGSSLKLNPDTNLTVLKGVGRPVILAGGASAMGIQYLEIRLAGGVLFGGLASHFYGYSGGAGRSFAASRHRYAAAPPPSLPWWDVFFSPHVRVKVDMPWGVAAVRGTFWETIVGPAGQTTTDVLTGEASLTSTSGQTVDLTDNQTSSIASPASPPTTPIPLNSAEKADWQEQGAWVQGTNSRIVKDTPRQPTHEPPAGGQGHGNGGGHGNSGGSHGNSGGSHGNSGGSHGNSGGGHGR